MWFNNNISTTRMCTVWIQCVYLTLLINTNDSRRAVVSGRDKYGFSTDAIHVYTHAWLQIIHVEITILCDEVDNTVLRTDLSEREMVWGYTCVFIRHFSHWNKVFTCMATGKSVCASGGKNTSTAFLVKGWLPAWGWPTSMMCSYNRTQTHIITHPNIYSHKLDSWRFCVTFPPAGPRTPKQKRVEAFEFPSSL